jgi:hypothetical protein
MLVMVLALKPTCLRNTYLVGGEELWKSTTSGGEESWKSTTSRLIDVQEHGTLEVLKLLSKLVLTPLKQNNFFERQKSTICPSICPEGG